MPTVLAEINWGEIGQVLWTGPLAGIGVTLLFSIGIYGSTKAAEAGRAKDSGRAAAFGVVAATAFLGVAAAIVFGVYVIIDK